MGYDAGGYDADRPELRVERLTTQHLLLTPLVPADDAVDLHVMLSDPAVHVYDPDAQPSSLIEETERRLGLQLMANGGASWALRLCADGSAGPAIGSIGLVGDGGTASRMIGWSLAPAYWGRHLMSEAARCVVGWLLAQDGVEELDAWVDAANAASLGVARAAGMAERERRPRRYDDGHPAETVVLSRSRDRR